MSGLRRALIVANDVYEHEGLKALRSPGADAEALAAVLSDPTIGDFDVHVLRNEPAHVITEQVEELLSESRPDDLLLLHFSCHGLKNESGELFFAASNTRLNRLASTAVPADFVQRRMRESRSRSIVLLLDCCYGGAFSRGVSVRAAGDANVLDSFPGGPLGGGRGRAVITASSAMEYAFEGDDLADDHSQHPSVFTSALVEGMATGDADRDQDGWVSLNELYDYVFDRVRERNPHQTPSRDVEMQGELYLTRRAVTVPAPLPAELQAVIDHPMAGIRAGAVEELAHLARGRHAGLALAASSTLQRLAQDDSRAVATAARAALSSAEGNAGVAPSLSTPAQPAPASIAPELAGDQAPPPRRNRQATVAFREHRRVIALGAAAVAVILAVTVTVLLRHSDPTSGADVIVKQGETFTATSPWRLVVRDATTTGNDAGCDLTLFDAGTNNAMVQLNGVYSPRSYQMRETGSFRWQGTKGQCAVTQRPGEGSLQLPAVLQLGGESDAFDVNGHVGVEVVDFNGNSGCRFELRDAVDGRVLASGSVHPGGGSLSLDPAAQPRVYLHSTTSCSARVSVG